MAESQDTYWVGFNDDRLERQSAFTITVKDSIDISGIDNVPHGITWDGTDILWTGDEANRSYKNSGFTITVLDSVATNGVDATVTGITWDGTHQYLAGNTNDYIYKCSGFTATITNSFDCSGVDNRPREVSWDGTNLLLGGRETAKLYLQSGFSVTVQNSNSVSGIDIYVGGISWDGSDVIWCGYQADKLYKSDTFAGVLEDSVSVGGTDVTPYGIAHGNFNQRVGIAAKSFAYTPKQFIGEELYDPGEVITGWPLHHMKERQAISEGVYYPAGSRGDSMRINYNSIESFSLRWAQTIPGVIPVAVNAANGPGVGILRSTGDGTLFSWKAPNSDLFGSTVDCSTDGSYVLEDGEDQMKAIRITVYNSYIAPNPIQSEVLLDVIYNNAVAGADVTAAEASSGDTSWWDFEQENVGSHDWLDVKCWMTQESKNNGIWISTDTHRESAEDDTLWCGTTGVRIYRNSSFTITQLDSIFVNGIDTSPQGVTWDGTNVMWSGDTDDKLYRQSGFTITVADSFSTGAIDNTPRAAGWDGTNIIWGGRDQDDMYRQSGFSATLLDSADMSAIETAITGTTWDGTHMQWSGSTDDKVYLSSGFSNNLTNSFDVGAIDTSPQGNSWTGFHVIWIGNTADRIYKNSGFSVTLSNSFSISGVDTNPRGIGFMNYANRTDDNWYQPTHEDHADALSWSRIAAAGTENVYVKRVVPASSAAAIKKEVQLEWAFDAI